MGAAFLKLRVHMADVPGVEPGIQESKSWVLPLHYTSILHSRRGYAHQEVMLITRNYTTFYTLRLEFIPMSCCCRGSSTCLCCVPTGGVKLLRTHTCHVTAWGLGLTKL